MAKDEEKKWRESEIESIVRRIINKEYGTFLVPLSSDSDSSNKEDKYEEKYNNLIDEYERFKSDAEVQESKLKSRVRELEKEKSDNEIKMEEWENKLRENNKKIEELESYKLHFRDLFTLYVEVTTISEKYGLSRFLDMKTPVKFAFSIANGKSINSLYDYLAYELNNLSNEIFGIYNKLLDFMCSVNENFEVIDCNGEIDDMYHVEIHNQHYGKIKQVIMNGYKYKVSGTAVKRALVEVF